MAFGVAVAAMLGGCDRADPIERLRAEVAMPACPGAKVERLPPVAGLEADYAVKVTAATACMSQWSTALAQSHDYYCQGKPIFCGRHDASGRYAFAMATISFVAPDRALVELTKI